MKKYYITTCYILFLLSLIGCDKEGILDEEITGYQAIETSFVFPTNIHNNYTYILNGDTLKNGKGFLPRTETTGKLEVFEKGSTKAVYLGDINLAESNTIQLIKLGDKIDIYSPDSYTQFTVDVKWATESDAQKFKALYNGVEISTSSLSKNYVSKKNLTDTLQIIKIEDNEIVLKKEVTVVPEKTLTLLQLGAQEFVSLPPGEEKAPEDPHYTKVRFYYTKTNELTEDSYTMKVVAFDEWYGVLDGAVEVGTVELNVGEISPYLTIDGRIFETSTTSPVSLTYDLIAKDGTVVRERTPNVIHVGLEHDWSDEDYFKFPYKFQTFNINIAGNASLVLKETW